MAVPCLRRNAAEGGLPQQSPAVPPRRCRRPATPPRACAPHSHHITLLLLSTLGLLADKWCPPRPACRCCAHHPPLRPPLSPLTLPFAPSPPHLAAPRSSLLRPALPKQVPACLSLSLLRMPHDVIRSSKMQPSCYYTYGCNNRGASGCRAEQPHKPSAWVSHKAISPVVHGCPGARPSAGRSGS